MKIAKILGGFVSLGLLAGLAVPFASAKPQAAPAAQAPAKGMGMHDKLQAALDSLNLTDDQKAKVKDILADAKTKRQAVLTDASLNEDQKRAKMKELHEGLLTQAERGADAGSAGRVEKQDGRCKGETACKALIE